MKQHSIKRPVTIAGIGLHTGKASKMTFKYAEAGSGINFIRTDLEGRPKVMASLENVSGTARGTNLGIVNTVEHVLSALYAMSVTNLNIEMDGPEPPAADGSSMGLVALIRSAGLVEQGPMKRTIRVKEPLVVFGKDSAITALPHNGLTVSFMINYPSDFIGSQFYRFENSEKGYEREIAPARTFGFLSELDELKSKGLALGASAKNAIVIGDKGYNTPLRFPDELVRHKILDLIGDISILNSDIRAHIICVRSGHELNIELAKKLKEVG